MLQKCILAASNNKFLGARRKFDVRDSKIFSDFRFLKEAKINVFLKSMLFIRYSIVKLFFKVYNNIKPKWFTPKVWFKQLS
jgi:hypothetical protein